MAGVLEGKAILDTGAGRGVGRGHAVTLADEGALVVVNDVGLDVKAHKEASSPADVAVEVIRGRGGQAVASYDDISDWEGAGRAVQQVIDTYGRIDGIVNNAGVLLNTTFDGVSEADFDTVLRVHVKGTFATTHHAVRHWKAEAEAGRATGGSIVNTVSDAMLLALSDPVYGAAKAAIAHLTLVGSVDCAPWGVRMNAIAPRAATRMSRSSALMQYPDDTRPLEADEYTEDSPMNPGNPSPVVAWLLSDRASHVTGQVFRMLAGAFARCTPWDDGELVWPEDGSMRFTIDGVEQAMNTRVFHSRFPRGRLEFAPGDPRSQK
jgi:NAD(P)-dependent dehydrogenase (short-subunit alcohol dehydrogenase family)